MPNQIEPNVNNTLGDLLRGMMPGSKVLSENTQTFPAHPGRHADILIITLGRSPVVVEAEYAPAPEVEQDATARLGLAVAGEPRTIEAAIALRYPASLEDAYELAQAVAAARISYCVATAEDIFNDFRDRELKPAYLADADPNRAYLDRRIVCDLLGFGETYTRECAATPPSGALNPPSTAARPAPKTPSL